MEQLNPRQQKFAELIVAGSTAKAAYFKSFPRCKSEKTAETEGCKLLKNPKVQKFIEALRWEVGEKVKSNLVADRQEVLEYLTEVMRTPAGMIDEEHKLCQSFKNTEGVREIKLPDKIKAIERMSKLQGWDSPELHRHDIADPVKELISQIRGGK